MPPRIYRPDDRPVLTPAQGAIYRNGWTPDARFRVAVCGRRFGKTFLGPEEIRRAARRAVANKIPPENEIWYGAPVLKQAKRVFWPRLKRSIPERWLAAKPNETELTLTLRPYGHVIRIVGLENYDDLRGNGLYFFLGDEWGDVRPEVWQEIIRPMLATENGNALIIGTPKGYNQLRDFYIKGQPGPAHESGWWSCQYTTAQGGNVPDAEIEAARRNLGEREFRQEFEASFETFAGRCIYAFDRLKSVVEMPYNPDLSIHVGMDFNINPMSATIWQEHTLPDGSATTYQVAELIMPTSNTSEMADELRRHYGRQKTLFTGSKVESVEHITIYPDPAGAANRTSAQGNTDISILKSQGFNVQAMSKAPLIRDRFNITNAMFCAADGVRRAFVSPKCVQSIACYEELSYREGTGQPDKSSGRDHVVDATGYYFYTRFSKHKLNINNGTMER